MTLDGFVAYDDLTHDYDTPTGHGATRELAKRDLLANLEL